MIHCLNGPVLTDLIRSHRSNGPFAVSILIHILSSFASFQCQWTVVCIFSKLVFLNIGIFTNFNDIDIMITRNVNQTCIGSSKKANIANNRNCVARFTQLNVGIKYKINHHTKYSFNFVNRQYRENRFK